jgi:phage baseplate assembly protein W
MREVLFEPMSTTMKTYLEDRIKTTLLIFESRITLQALQLDTSLQHEGRVAIILDYTIKATNSRYNLVFPFYEVGSEVRPGFGPL